MLTIDPAQRWTLQQVRQHPWLREYVRALRQAGRGAAAPGTYHVLSCLHRARARAGRARSSTKVDPAANAKLLACPLRLFNLAGWLHPNVVRLSGRPVCGSGRVGAATADDAGLAPRSRRPVNVRGAALQRGVAVSRALTLPGAAAYSVGGYAPQGLLAADAAPGGARQPPRQLQRRRHVAAGVVLALRQPGAQHQHGTAPTCDRAAC